MRVLTVMVLALFGSAGYGQDMVPPLTEMKAVEFMVGHWQGDMTFSFMGQTSKSKGAMHAVKSLNDRYIQSTNTYEMEGMGKMEGLHLLTFDPESKQYVAYWFDSSAPGAMELKGTLVGNTLTMTSKPTKIPGMPGEPVFRSTWKKVDATHIGFTLEMQEGPKWNKMIDGSYTKK